MVQVSAEEAKTKLLDLIAEAIKGEAVFITQDGRQAVQLVPVEHSEARPRFGSAKGLIAMSDDFDAPLEDFDEYIP